MNKHPEPLFQKRNFSPPGMINFANIFITLPKTFQFDLGVAGKEILTLSALYRFCQFLPLSDRSISQSTPIHLNFLFFLLMLHNSILYNTCMIFTFTMLIGVLTDWLSKTQWKPQKVLNLFYGLCLYVFFKF